LAALAALLGPLSGGCTFRQETEITLFPTQTDRALADARDRLLDACMEYERERLPAGLVEARDAYLEALRAHDEARRAAAARWER
jgi:hypothetical protein